MSGGVGYIPKLNIFLGIPTKTKLTTKLGLSFLLKLHQSLPFMFPRLSVDISSYESYKENFNQIPGGDDEKLYIIFFKFHPKTE